MKPGAYWLARALSRMLDIELMGNGYADRIIALYMQTLSLIEGDILHLFRRYRDQGALTEEEALQLLNDPIDRATWEWLRQRIEAMADGARKRRLLAQMNAPGYAARISRLRALQIDLQMRCTQLAQRELPLHTEALRTVGEESYLRALFDTQQQAADAAGAHPHTGEMPAAKALPGTTPPSLPALKPESPAAPPHPPSVLPKDALESLLAERWSGAHYSDRVWANTGELARRVADIVRTNMATGRSWRRCLDAVQDLAAMPGQGALYAAQRLLRTETNYMANQTALQAMRDMDVKYYRYIATLDERMSETCGEHDGRIDPDTGKSYTIDKARAGVNVPPLHPNCRSTIAPIVDGAVVEGMLRAARDPVTGKTVMVPAEMTYPQWKQQVLGQPGISAVTKERLLGGKKKRILFDAGVLEPKDYSVPWKVLEKRGMIVPSDAVVEHSSRGDFKSPSKAYPQGRMSGGGHGQENFTALAQIGVTPSIAKIYGNGVRVGSVPGHADKNKRGADGQLWFPASWLDADVQQAGTYCANRGKDASASWGSAKEADWRGVRVRVTFDVTGRPTSIHPSFEQEGN